LVDNQSRVPIDIETFDTKLDRNAQTMQACFVLGGVIRRREINPEDVSELLLGW